MGLLPAKIPYAHIKLNVALRLKTLRENLFWEKMKVVLSGKERIEDKA